MLGAILLGFWVGLLFFFLGKYVKSKYFYFFTLYPLAVFIFFAQYVPTLTVGKSILFKTAWVPQLNIGFDFKLDGLALMFSLLISGIGALIFTYTHKYLYGNKNLDKFYAYLSMFMASMLGVVLSDNIITLLVFWELTSISSFFLIGFNSDDETSRKNANLALSITGIGGFFLLAGFLWLGTIGGTFSITELIAKKDELLQHSSIVPILCLLFIGAFTKSAQFPFHFWLPNAMKAPTPVSAYLHSATMVKAGIYLLARVSPLFSGHPFWHNTLIIVGTITMAYTAINAIYRTDLKGVLAYSTIAVLGMLVMLIGIGTPLALKAMVVFLVAHALYKASLFLITGIIDHEAHTRDITLLSGLRKVLPLVFIAGILTILSNAGIPFSFGFIGKEMIYESLLHFDGAPTLIWILVTLTVIANICIGYAGYQVGLRPFVGVMPEKFARIKPISIFLLLPPLLLSIAGIFYGIFPKIADEILLKSATQSVIGYDVYQPLKIWHGFNLTLLLSVITILLGLLLYFLRPPSKQKEAYLLTFDAIKPENLYYKFKDITKKAAKVYTKTMHSGYLRIYIMTIILFIVMIVGYKLFSEVPLRINTQTLSSFRLYELAVFAIIIVAIFATIITQSRLTSIASMSVVGYSICLLFVFYGAPDLAMTQFTIDTLTLVLFVLVLFRLPTFMKYAKPQIIIRDAIISLSFGALISIITLQALVYPAEKEISKYYAENAYLMAKGKNVVNVILVDFRGFDTMVESIVLTIAALGVYSLLKLQVNSSDKE